MGVFNLRVDYLIGEIELERLQNTDNLVSNFEIARVLYIECSSIRINSFTKAAPSVNVTDDQWL